MGIRKFVFILLGFIFILIIALIIYFPAIKNKSEIKNSVMEIRRMENIPQENEYYIVKPKKIIGYKDKIYVLDSKFYRILVYSKDGFSHHISSPGMGPAQISQPISLVIEDEILYILNFPDRIEVFDLQGKYIKTIRLKIENTLIKSIWDFQIYGQKIYVSLNVGEIKVQRYDINGRFIDNFILGGKKVELNKIFLSVPNNIYIIPRLNKLILFNQFDGDIQIFHLHDGTLITSIRDYDSIISRRTSLIIKDINNTRPEDKMLQIKNYLMFHSTLDLSSLKLFILPSQISLDREEKRNILYTFDLETNLIDKNNLVFEVGDQKYIENLCFIEDNLVFIDDDLNLNIGEYK